MKNRQFIQGIVAFLLISIFLGGLFIQIGIFIKESSKETMWNLKKASPPLKPLSEPDLKLQWSFNTSLYVISDVLWGVAAGDGNGDNQLEIAMVGENGTLFCLNGSDGSFLWKYFLSGPTYSVTFGDIDGDNKDELITTRIFPGFPKKLNITVFNFETEFPISGYQFEGLPAFSVLGVGAGNIRNNSKEDVFFFDNQGILYVFDGETNVELDKDFWLGLMIPFNGGLHQGFDVNSGDIDNDGILEFVISGIDGASGNGSTSLHRWSGGEVVRIWKFLLNTSAYCSTADLGDVDGDGKAEVIVGTRQNGATPGGKVYLLNGETKEVLWEFDTGSNNIYDISSGDLHNDGRDEIAVAVGGILNYTYILEGENNTVLWGIPSDTPINGVELADVNSDGKSEIITISDNSINLYCIDTDGDGLTDMNDLDDDNDNLTDSQEAILYNTNQFHIDSDFDNLSDIAELFAHGTNPIWWDTDDDNLSDWQELFTTFTMPNNSNSDGDYLSDGEEIPLGLDPNDPDTYDDGFLDSISYFLDDDNDNLTNHQEINIYMTYLNDADTDNDNLSDWQEIVLYNTNPNKINTDGDLLSDWQEIFEYHTNPNDPDSNDDGYLDGQVRLPIFNWLLYIVILLAIATVILLGLNVRYYRKLNELGYLERVKKKKARTLRKIIQKAVWFWGHGATVLKNYDKLTAKNVKIITLEALTRTWTQHYKRSFQKLFNLSDQEAAERAENQKKQDIQELYDLLKDKIDIKIVPIKFGKYAGSDSYQFEVRDDERKTEEKTEEEAGR